MKWAASRWVWKALSQLGAASQIHPAGQLPSNIKMASGPAPECALEHLHRAQAAAVERAGWSSAEGRLAKEWQGLEKA